MSRLVEAGGQRFKVAVRPGDGTRTPLLLMNGIGAALETFEPLVRALDPALDVIRFDVPGVGGSPLPARPYRYTSLSRQVGALLDVLGYPEADVLGISWGGALAQQFAFTERRRCRRLVLVATGPGVLMVPASPKVLAKLVTPRRYRDPKYLMEIAPELYGGTVREDPTRLAALLAEFGHGGQTRGYAYQLIAAWGWSALALLPLLRSETLVLTGDDDPIIPVANGRILAGLVPRARLHVYHGGHIDLVSKPDLLVPVIEDFLA